MPKAFPGVFAAVAALGVVCVSSSALAQSPAIQTPASAPIATGPVRVFWGGAALPIVPDAAPFRDPADGALCVAPQSLAPLGASYLIDEKMGKATFALPDGGAVVTVNLRPIPAGVAAKGWFVPVMEVVEGLGGKCEWDPQTGILYARSVLTGVEVVAGQLQVKATLPVRATVSRNGTRTIILDFAGAEIGTLPRTLNLNIPAVSAARTGQFAHDIARIVLETRDGKVAFLPVSDRPLSVVALNQVGASVLPAAPVASVRPPSVASAKLTTTGARPRSKTPVPPSLISGVTLRQVNDDRVQLVVNAARGAKNGVPQAALNRQTLTLDFLNASLGADAAASLAAANHPFVKAARFVAGTNGVARLVLDLTRTVTFSVRPGADGSVLLDLGLPKGAGGRLAGKFICVDAGHGDNDKGARGVNGTWEKNVNLAIATRLADTLREAGANVMMIRSGDTFTGVNERPRVANRAGADFFLSVHSDSIDYNRNINGSTVYYHQADPYCRTLAQCIVERFEQMGGIKTKGKRSDSVLHGRQGLGVLRGARMAAVLVECGYMTNPSDVRKLNDPAWQKKIAESIAFGLRDYIEGNPDIDFRNTNPNVPVTPPSDLGIPTETVSPAVEQSEEEPNLVPSPNPDPLEAQPSRR